MARGKLTRLELLLEVPKPMRREQECEVRDDVDLPEKAKSAGREGAGATEDSWGARRLVAEQEGMVLSWKAGCAEGRSARGDDVGL